MSTLARLLRLCAVSALLAACGGGSSGNGTLIGATCARSVECGPAGICVTTGKDGQCALSCQVSGGAQECPLGTYCDRESVKTDLDPKSDMVLCFPACLTNANCRDGYECKGVSSGPGKVCQPK
ncbi:MAG TPA: hypothetical protein VF331_12890 [Polyangiales bacterium]